MHTPESLAWAGRYLFEDCGFEAPANAELKNYKASEYNNYVKSYYIPVKLLTAAVAPESIDWSKLNCATDAVAYLESLPANLSLPEFEEYMDGIFSSHCWRHCLPELAKEYKYNSNAFHSLRAAADVVLANYVLRTVTFGADAANVAIYIHKLTKEPVGDYAKEVLVYPDEIQALPGRSTLLELATKMPMSVTQTEKQLLSMAISLPIMSSKDLLQCTCFMPVGKEICYVNVTALSPMLPPYSVMQLLQAIPESMVHAHGNEYRALAYYVSTHPSTEFKPEVLLYLEQIKEYLESEESTRNGNITDTDVYNYVRSVLGLNLDSLEELTTLQTAEMNIADMVTKYCSSMHIDEQCTIEQFIYEFKTKIHQEPEKVTLKEFSDNAIILEAAERLGISADDIRGYSVREELPEITEKNVLTFINEKQGSVYATLSEIFDEQTTMDSANYLLRYIDQQLKIDSSVQEAVKIKPLADLASAFALSRGNDFGTRLSFDIHLRSIDKDRPDYVTAAQEAIKIYMGERKVIA